MPRAGPHAALTAPAGTSRRTAGSAASAGCDRAAGAALGELFDILVRKAGRRANRARQAVLSWHDAYPVMETTAAVMVDATDLAAHHSLTIWDSVVLAAAAQAECRLLLSQDLQEGFTWRGVTVANPFAPDLNPILAASLAHEE